MSDPKLGYRRGPLGFSVLQIWPMVGSVFRFLHLKTVVFWSWGLPRCAGFLEFSLWFSVFVNNDGGYSGFFAVPFKVFLVLPRKLHPTVAQKPM